VYEDRGHAETQYVDGIVLETKHDLIDENRKGLKAWFERQVNYAYEDAVYDLRSGSAVSNNYSIFSKDPLERRASLKRLSRALPLRPLWYFLYSYIWRGGFLDGYPGFMFCYMRSVYQSVVVISKYDYTQSNREW
jgi:hypothetical protein